MADKKTDDGKKPIGASAIKPETKPGFAGCMEFLYNKKNGTVLGRTGKSWALITIFYIIYYACLAGFWAAMLTVFFTTIDNDKPKWVAGDSLIGDKPGIGIRPGQSEESVGSSVMYLNTLETDLVGGDRDAKDNHNLGYATRLEEFFKKYRECDGHVNEVCKSKKATDCKTNTMNNQNAFDKDKSFCEFDLESLGTHCTTWPYGYGKDLKPCVIVKLNRIYNLTLEPFQSGSDIPEDLKASEDVKEFVDKHQEPKEPFVWCEGEYPADRDLLSDDTDTKMEYFPKSQSFPLEYFPVLTKDQNQNTMVALQFSDLPTGRMIQVICKVFYKGVKQEKKTKSGLVQFQLFVNK